MPPVHKLKTCFFQAVIPGLRIITMMVPGDFIEECTVSPSEEMKMDPVKKGADRKRR